DLQIVARPGARAGAQDDAVQDQLPEQTLVLDHARVGEKFPEVGAHALASAVSGVPRLTRSTPTCDGGAFASSWEAAIVMRPVPSRAAPSLSRRATLRYCRARNAMRSGIITALWVLVRAPPRIKARAGFP